MRSPTESHQGFVGFHANADKIVELWCTFQLTAAVAGLDLFEKHLVVDVREIFNTCHNNMQLDKSNLRKTHRCTGCTLLSSAAATLGETGVNQNRILPAEARASTCNMHVRNTVHFFQKLLLIKQTLLSTRAPQQLHNSNYRRG